jgi:cyclopropane-fatty-acyl-phospholipid synthase
MTRQSRFVVEELENIGPHYARTLREWRERFLQHSDALAGMGFDQAFQRKWVYYLSYCEAGFATRTLGDLQLVLTRLFNRNLPLGR